MSVREDIQNVNYDGIVIKEKYHVIEIPKEYMIGYLIKEDQLDGYELTGEEHLKHLVEENGFSIEEAQ